MGSWRRIQPLVMLAVSVYVVVSGVVSLTGGRTGFGILQVLGGVLLAAIVVYEAKVVEPRRRAREADRRR